MIKEKELYYELFEEPERKFKTHLAIPNNNRIILSGRFGHGKTTFLQEFFNKENQLENYRKTKYNIITIYPVNYSVASNEDIFKYIKYDIILEMLRKGYDIHNEVTSYLKTLPEFFKKNAHKVFASLMYMIPLVGKDIIDSYEKLDKIKDDFFKYHDDVSNKKKDGDMMVNYMEKIEQTEGSIFEDDTISKLIEKALKSEKEKSEYEENVLVIDDLDRIDPEHIFRILNIFSAHFDRQNPINNTNKFGFDKVIIVCDIDNIRNIFNAKYGVNTDFNGYIDKFYSHSIFEYFSGYHFKNICRKTIFNMQWEYDSSGYSTEENKQIYLHKDNFLFDVLGLFYHNMQLDLRNIIKLKNVILKNPYGYSFNKRYKLEDNTIIFAFSILKTIKGGTSALSETIKSCHLEYLPSNLLIDYCDKLIFILTSQEHKGRLESNHYYSYMLIDKHIYLKLSTNNSPNEKPYSTEYANNRSQVKYSNKEFIWLLNETMNFLTLNLDDQ